MNYLFASLLAIIFLGAGCDTDSSNRKNLSREEIDAADNADILRAIEQVRSEKRIDTEKELGLACGENISHMTGRDFIACVMLDTDGFSSTSSIILTMDLSPSHCHKKVFDLTATQLSSCLVWLLDENDGD